MQSCAIEKRRMLNKKMVDVLKVALGLDEQTQSEVLDWRPNSLIFLALIKENIVSKIIMCFHVTAMLLFVILF